VLPDGFTILHLEATYENSVETDLLLGLNALGSVKFRFMLIQVIRSWGVLIKKTVTWTAEFARCGLSKIFERTRRVEGMTFLHSHTYLLHIPLLPYELRVSWSWGLGMLGQIACFTLFLTPGFRMSYIADCLLQGTPQFHIPPFLNLFLVTADNCVSTYKRSKCMDTNGQTKSLLSVIRGT
jgi:hypothetical protein